MERRGFGSNGMLPALILHTASEYYGLDRKPPVTAALIAANTLVYLRPAILEPFLPSINDVSFNPHLILKNKDMKRFLLSPFYHVGESHLVYNMLSLLWKGIKLESSMDSAEFASMVAVLLGMSQGITLAISKAMLVLFDYEKAYYSEYAVGFSGVLFALKVVLNARSGNYTLVHGVPVPNSHAAWVELVLIQMLVPGVSFVGHLGGILAGLLYLRLRGAHSGFDPLTALFRGVTDVVKLPLRLLSRLFPIRRRQVSGRGPVGGRPRGMAAADWRCNACTYENLGWFDVCEMCGTSNDNGTGNNTMASLPPPLQHYPGDLTLEELRQRRMERFGR